MKQHLDRWLIVAAVLIIVLVVLGLSELLGGAAPPPLALPDTTAAAPVGPLDGAWVVGPGSQAGFRLNARLLWLRTEAVGRTEAVSGTMVVAGGRATAATVRVALSDIHVGGPSLAPTYRGAPLDRSPSATITLERPLALHATAPMTARLAIDGMTREVTFTTHWRRDGPLLQGAGVLDVNLSDWGITLPRGSAWIRSLANRGTAEFLLVLQPSTAGIHRAGA